MISPPEHRRSIGPGQRGRSGAHRVVHGQRVVGLVPSGIRAMELADMGVSNNRGP